MVKKKKLMLLIQYLDKYFRFPRYSNVFSHLVSQDSVIPEQSQIGVSSSLWSRPAAQGTAKGWVSSVSLMFSITELNSTNVQLNMAEYTFWKYVFG